MNLVLVCVLVVLSLVCSMGAVSSSGGTTSIEAALPADAPIPPSITTQHVSFSSDPKHYLKKLSCWLVHTDGSLVTKATFLTYFNTMDGDSGDRDRVVRFRERRLERLALSSKAEDVLR